MSCPEGMQRFAFSFAQFLANYSVWHKVKDVGFTYVTISREYTIKSFNEKAYFLKKKKKSCFLTLTEGTCLI